MLEAYDVARDLDSFRNAYAAGLPVSEAAKRVVEVMVGMSLATQSRLAAALRRTTADLQAPLAELREKGLVTSVVLGSAAAGSKPAERLYFTDLAIEQFGDLPVTWHEAGNRAALLDRLPVVDACYLAATAIDRYGRFLEFRWLDGVGLSAVARYEHGWVGLIWSGMLETVTELDARFGRLAADISSLAVGRESHPWPGILAAVVPDPWQRELVLNAAQRWGLDDQVATWCISDGSRTRASTEGVSRGWIHQEAVPREIGNWAWDDRVQSSIWAQLRTPFLYRVFRIIAEYPGINRRMTQRMLGEAPGGHQHQAVHPDVDPPEPGGRAVRQGHRRSQQIGFGNEEVALPVPEGHRPARPHGAWDGHRIPGRGYGPVVDQEAEAEETRTGRRGTDGGLPVGGPEHGGRVAVLRWDGPSRGGRPRRHGVPDQGLLRCGMGLPRV